MAFQSTEAKCIGACHLNTAQRCMGCGRTITEIIEAGNLSKEQAMSERVFVFGSNEAGRHGKGAALVAYKKHKARYGMSYGHVGDSFAIPTKDQELKPLSLERINQYIQGFLAYAAGHPELTFQVARIGCGLAGFTNQEIAPMFLMASWNCHFDDAWAPIIGDRHIYWGTYP